MLSCRELGGFLPSHWARWVEPVSLPWGLMRGLSDRLNEPKNLRLVPVGVPGLRAGRQGHSLPPWEASGPPPPLGPANALSVMRLMVRFLDQSTSSR